MPVSPRAGAHGGPQATDNVLHVTVAGLCKRFRLMFFGNLRQDWSEFVLADLGIFNYEPVKVTVASRAFDHASEIDTYMALHDARCAVDKSMFEVTINARIDALACPTPWLAQRRDRIRFLLGHGGGCGSENRQNGVDAPQ